jgi:hypothetical protein
VKKCLPTAYLRASPRVCQILLGKSCVLPTSKKYVKFVTSGVRGEGRIKQRILSEEGERSPR